MERSLAQTQHERCTITREEEWSEDCASQKVPGLDVPGGQEAFLCGLTCSSCVWVGSVMVLGSAPSSQVYAFRERRPHKGPKMVDDGWREAWYDKMLRFKSL